MTTVILRNMPEAFAIHLREAADALGLVRLDRFDELLALYRERWPHGVSANMFRQADFAPFLTDRGGLNAYHAQRTTFVRALHNLRRDEFDAKEVHWSTFSPRIRFRAQADLTCQRASELHGKIADRTARWALPLPSCDREWCPCSWDYVTDLDR